MNHVSVYIYSPLLSSPLHTTPDSLPPSPPPPPPVTAALHQAMSSMTVSPSSIKRASLLCPSFSISKNSLPKTPSFLQFKTQEPKIYLPSKTLAFSTGRVNATHVVNNNAPKKPTENPIIVIDNYDSFTYNLCQVGLNFWAYFVCACVCFFLAFKINCRYDLLKLFFPSIFMLEVHGRFGL